MADRPDSIDTLSTIDVPTLVIAGEQDIQPLTAAELMHERIAGSTLEIIPKAGHYAAMERPEEYALALCRFVDEVYDNLGGGRLNHEAARNA